MCLEWQPAVNSWPAPGDRIYCRVGRYGYVPCSQANMPFIKQPWGAEQIVQFYLGRPLILGLGPCITCAAGSSCFDWRLFHIARSRDPETQNPFYGRYIRLFVQVRLLIAKSVVEDLNYLNNPALSGAVKFRGSESYAVGPGQESYWWSLR